MPSIGRRSLLGVAGASLVGSVAVGRAWNDSDFEPATRATDWHQPRRDAGNTAVTDDPGPGATGEIEWVTRAQTNGTGGFEGLVMWDDTLVVPTARRLVGFDATTGDRVWTIGPDERRRALGSSPLVRDSTVYLAVGGVYVYAVSLEDRRPRWRYRTNGSIRAMHLAGNTLCFSSFDDDGNVVVALDTETGRPRWQTSDWWYEAGASGTRLVAVRRADADDLQLELVGVDLETGDTEWARSHEAFSLGSSVVCLEDRTVVTGSGGTAVLDSASGERETVLEGVTATGAVAVDAGANRLFATDPKDEVVTSVSLTGETEWTVERPVEGGLAVGGETVYATTPTGLCALDVDDGDERFTVSTDDANRSGPSDWNETTPLVAGDAVYYRRGETVCRVGGA